MGDKAFAYISIQKRNWEAKGDFFIKSNHFNCGEEDEIEKGVMQLEWEDYWPDIWVSIRWFAGNGITSYGWLEDSGNDTTQLVCTIAGKTYCFDSLHEAPGIMVGEKSTASDLKKAKLFIERFDKAKKLVNRK